MHIYIYIYIYILIIIIIIYNFISLCIFFIFFHIYLFFLLFIYIFIYFHIYAFIYARAYRFAFDTGGDINPTPKILHHRVPLTEFTIKSTLYLSQIIVNVHNDFILDWKIVYLSAQICLSVCVL